MSFRSIYSTGSDADDRIVRLIVLAEVRVRSENVGATVAIEKFSWKRVKQGISAPSTIILAFIFGFNNVTVQCVLPDGCFAHK